ncbi:MAG: lipid-A-disaccharide synthase [Bacteroidales bacterium]|nr:lipid-A-disaccharide synthase [Bacteroidales bacterium]
MRYYIIAGEASGDLHASNLMRGLYAEDPQACIRFRGGDLMKAVYDAHDKGTDGGLTVHYRQGAMMGLSEILRKAGMLFRSLRECKADIAAWKPDAVILVDYPGFNFPIARFAHGQGFKVFWYIAPKTWASREGRNRKLRRYVDRLFIVFPFEIPYFTKADVPFVYKGNPLLDAIDNAPALRQSREAFLAAHGLEDKPFIAMLAGSRKGEISRMMPPLVQVAQRLKTLPGYRDYQFLLAGAPARSEADYLPYIESHPDIHLIFGDTYGILRHAGAAVINSGTASLEAALIGTPQVVCWSTTRFNMFLARHLLRIQDKIKYISLANLILDKAVFRELIQEDFTAENVISELLSLAPDSARTAAMKADYRSIREALGGGGASCAVAASIIELIRHDVP